MTQDTYGCQQEKETIVPQYKCPVVTETMRKSSIMIKGTAIAPQAWTGPEICMSLRLPDYKISATLSWYECQPYTPNAFTAQ
jgi:hypothetical protein